MPRTILEKSSYTAGPTLAKPELTKNHRKETAFQTKNTASKSAGPLES